MNRISQLAYMAVSVVTLTLVGGVARASTDIIDATTGNGSFESGTDVDTGGGLGLLHPGNSNDELTNWTVGSATIAYYWLSDPGNAENGNRWVNFATSGASHSIRQSFPVTADDTYVVSYYEAVRVAPTATLNATISLAVGGASGTLSQTANNETPVGPPIVWQQFTFSFIPDTTTTATLTFAAAASYSGVADGGYGTGLDNVVVTETLPVPEPASVSLLAVGGLLVLRRRR